jgi:hypothetical protein
MSDDIAVSRRIGAPAHALFRLLTDPARHPSLDGSGMLRGAVSDAPITAVGDVFVIRMYYVEHGDYEMDNHVVGFVPDRHLAWEPRPGRGHPDLAVPDGGGWHHRWAYDLAPAGPAATVVTETYNCARVPPGVRAGMDDGRIWIAAMTETLRRLDAAATRTAGSAPGSR